MIFITGAPRSRTSLVAKQYYDQGYWVGPHHGPHPEQPYGFFENLQIKQLMKNIMAVKGFDPLGIDPLPPLNWNPEPAVAQILREQMENIVPAHDKWIFKDPKICLMWRVFADVYPDAEWIHVTRDVYDTAASIKRTSFIRCEDPYGLINRYRARCWEIPNITEVNTDEICNRD